MEVLKLHARELGPHFIVCLRIYTYRFIHEHAVVGSDKKLSKYEGKLLSHKTALINMFCCPMQYCNLESVLVNILCFRLDLVGPT